MRPALPLLLLLAACGPTDDDGDGFPATEDCDDTDETVFPGAREFCDGVDHDCNGVPDDPPDRDGDGATRCDGDCNDADAAINPFRAEACDGIDTNCDGELSEIDIDEDGDGFLPCDECDDDDPTIHPDAPERCDDVDWDCDGDPRDGETAYHADRTVVFGYQTFDGTQDWCDSDLPLEFCAQAFLGEELADTTGLHCLTWAREGLQVMSGATLEEVNLPRLEDSGALFVVMGMVELRTVSMPALQSADYLLIRANDALTTVEVGTGLTDLAFGLSLHDNDQLTTLAGFEGLSTLGGGLEISNNDALTDLSTFSRLSAIDGYFAIVGNPSLPTARAEALLAQIGEENITGEVLIKANLGAR